MNPLNARLSKADSYYKSALRDFYFEIASGLLGPGLAGLACLLMLVLLFRLFSFCRNRFAAAMFFFVSWAHIKQRPECDPAQKLSLREAASTNHDSCRFFALCLPLLALGILPNAHYSCPGCFALLICAGPLRICAIVGLLGDVCFSLPPNIIPTHHLCLWGSCCGHLVVIPPTEPLLPPCHLVLLGSALLGQLPCCQSALQHSPVARAQQW